MLINESYFNEPSNSEISINDINANIYKDTKKYSFIMFFYISNIKTTDIVCMLRKLFDSSFTVVKEYDIKTTPSDNKDLVEVYYNIYLKISLMHFFHFWRMISKTFLKYDISNIDIQNNTLPNNIIPDFWLYLKSDPYICSMILFYMAHNYKIDTDIFRNFTLKAFNKTNKNNSSNVELYILNKIRECFLSTDMNIINSEMVTIIFDENSKTYYSEEIKPGEERHTITIFPLFKENEDRYFYVEESFEVTMCDEPDEWDLAENTYETYKKTKPNNIIVEHLDVSNHKNHGYVYNYRWEWIPEFVYIEMKDIIVPAFVRINFYSLKEKES